MVTRLSEKDFMSYIKMSETESCKGRLDNILEKIQGSGFNALETSDLFFLIKMYCGKIIHISHQADKRENMYLLRAIIFRDGLDLIDYSKNDFTKVDPVKTAKSIIQLYKDASASGGVI